MSRQELAEAVNAYLWGEYRIRERLDEKDIGKLERGENRWPRARRREAFRAVLGVESDKEIGFYIVRGATAGTDLASGGVLSPSDPDILDNSVGEPGVRRHAVVHVFTPSPSATTADCPGTAVTMGQTLNQLEPTRSALHFFGAEVRRLRQEQGMTQADLGKLLLDHNDLPQKIEAAQWVPSEDLVRRCDRVLDAGGDLRNLWPMLERERRMRLAGDAANAAGFRSEAIDRPVLDWLLASTQDARSQRMDDEVAYTGANKLSHLRNDDRVHGAGQTYPAVASVLGTDLHTLITRAPAVAAGFLELAGYEAVDLGADGLAQRHYLRALEVITAGGDRLYGGYLIAVSLAHLALHCGDADQAARLAAAALRGTEHQTSPAVRAAFRAVLARAHARRGDQAACATALLQVEADLSRSKHSEEPAWIRYFGEADLADEKAHCFFDLGLHELAQREATQAVTLLEPSRARRLAIDTALHAASLARVDEIEHACAIGRQAVDHAAGVASFRGAHRIVLMMAELQPHADLPVVRDLAEYVRIRLTQVITPGQTSQLP